MDLSIEGQLIISIVGATFLMRDTMIIIAWCCVGDATHNFIIISNVVTDRNVLGMIGITSLRW